MKDSLSIDDARKLVLLSQGLPSFKRARGPLDSTLSALEQLGYVQIDTISVIQRAHHHTLWNRNPRYTASHLDQLVAEKRVFEYWSHAAAYLPMRDFRFSLPRKRAIACGEQEHWFERNPRLENQVLKRIASEGPLMAKDFENSGKRIGDWKIKPAKRALETLFMQGDLMVSQRINFQKVYDLTERALPTGTDTTDPTPEEHARFLITRFLRANGLGQAAEIAYLLPKTRPLIHRTMMDMVATGELRQIRVEDKDYHVLPDSLETLNKPLARSRLKILSPFDNLVIQRKRMQALFGFNYLIECYLPAAKRQYGYFTLPILWNGRLAARMDCKAERRTSLLHIHHLALEPWLVKKDAFLEALVKELASFLQFNECTRLRVHRTTPDNLKLEVEESLNRLGQSRAPKK